MTQIFPNIQNFTPHPEIGRFIDTMMGREHTSTPLMVEFIVDEPVMKAILTGLFGVEWVNPGPDRDSQKKYLDNLIFFWYRMGYDMMRYEGAPAYPGSARVTQNTAGAAGSTRSWVEESTGAITSWKDFETYKFPRVEEFDFFPFEYLNNHLPEGMGLALAHGGGLFERVSWIFSIEKLCYLLFDQPDLVEAVIQRVSEIQFDFYRNILSLDHLSAIFPGDDLGFRSATIISPGDLRKYILPFHTRLAAMTHTRGIPYFLHSCGNLLKIMPDLIDTVGLDGKHSYEDAIIPIEEFQKLYGDRVAVLGGMDIHFLATASQDQVRARVRRLVETCSPQGRFAIGSGNSIPDYVPVENYLAMVDEVISLKKE